MSDSDSDSKKWGTMERIYLKAAVVILLLPLLGTTSATRAAAADSDKSGGQAREQIGSAHVLATSSSTVVLGTDPNDAIAQIGSKVIRLDQLQPQSSAGILNARAKLLQARYELYVVERDELKKLIDNELLAEQAHKENVSVDILLERHVKTQIKDPSEEALRIYYLGIEQTQPYDVIHDKLRAYIRHLEETKAQADYIASLRPKYKVRIMLDPPNVGLPPDLVYVSGPPNAPVTMVEFADYQCPYCRRSEPDVQRLREEFRDHLRYGFKDFPLPMHEYAEKAAEAARCAGGQGQYWSMHDRLFAASSLAVPELKTIARDLKLDAARFDKCLDSGEMAKAINNDKEEAKGIGLSGTPSFIVNGYFFSGATSYEILREFIEQQVQSKGISLSVEPRLRTPVSSNQDYSMLTY